eukprot:1321358-Amphidinium_carterae.1
MLTILSTMKRQSVSCDRIVNIDERGLLRKLGQTQPGLRSHKHTHTHSGGLRILCCSSWRSSAGETLVRGEPDLEAPWGKVRCRGRGRAARLGGKDNEQPNELEDAPAPVPIGCFAPIAYGQPSNGPFRDVREVANAMG